MAPLNESRRFAVNRPLQLKLAVEQDELARHRRGLQRALLVTPACYLAAAALYWRAETLLEERKAEEAAGARP